MNILCMIPTGIFSSCIERLVWLVVTIVVMQHTEARVLHIGMSLFYHLNSCKNIYYSHD